MMEITYSKGQTLQVRQFEPVNVHFSAKSETTKETYIEDYAELKRIVDEQVEIAVKILQEPHKVAYQASKTLVNKDAKKEVSPF